MHMRRACRITLNDADRLAVDDHRDKYHQFLLDADKTLKFADLARRRLRKLFGLANASTLREISLEGVWMQTKIRLMIFLELTRVQLPPPPVEASARILTYIYSSILRRVAHALCQRPSIPARAIGNRARVRYRAPGTPLDRCGRHRRPASLLPAACHQRSHGCLSPPND